MDVIETIRRFREQLQAQGYAPATVALYAAGLDRFERYLSAHELTDLRVVTRATMTDYQSQVMAGPQTIETKALRLRPVKRLFEALTRCNRLLINPAEEIIETRRRINMVGPTITREEMQSLLSQPDTRYLGAIRDRCVMEVLYATAIRRAELLSLNPSDVDLDNGIMMINRGKGHKQRIVPIGEVAGRWLQRYLAEVRPTYCRNAPQEQRLFLACNGKPLSSGALRANLLRYRKRAGIVTSVSPHVFRRSCATHMVAAGADIRHIQQLLGHESLGTTQIYCKVMPIDLKRAHQEAHPNERAALHP